MVRSQSTTGPTASRLVFADLLMLPMVVLIAYWLATRAGVEAEAAALFSALCTVGADRLVKTVDRSLPAARRQ